MENLPTKNRRGLARGKRTRVKTTFLELIDNLIDLAPDDAALIASVKRIFEISDVRLVRSFAPVRLVTKESTLGANRQTKPAWA